MRLAMRVRRLLGTSWMGPAFLLIFLSVTVASSAATSPAVECGGAVQNGCFQAATDCTSTIEGWTTDGNLSSFVVDDNVRVSDITQVPLPLNYRCSGDFFVRLGVPVPPVFQPRSWAALYQDITVPDGPESRPELKFRYRIVTHDIKDWSAFRAEIRWLDSSPRMVLLEDGYVPSSGNFGEKNNDLGWKVVTADLSAFKGETVRLWFQNEHKWDKAVGIWTYLDDVVVFDNQYQIYMPIMPTGFQATGGFTSSGQGAERLSRDEVAPGGAIIPRPPTPTPTGG